MSQKPATTILNLVQRARDMRLGEALYGPELVRAARTTERALSDDGNLTRLGGASLPEQRLDWVIQPSTSAGVLVPRFWIPGASVIKRIVAIASGNASSTFAFDLLINGVRPSGGSGSIRVGTNSSSGGTSIAVPAGSVVSLETKNSIAQGVTITIFYRPSEG